MRAASPPARNPKSERATGLAVDLYELTMAAAYFETGLHETATFELFVRTLPPQRSFLIVAGLAQALEFLERSRFDKAAIRYLRQQPVFRNVSARFFKLLSRWRFTGDVWALPEGTAAFAGEPLLRITAPIVDAQIVETFLLATIGFQTMIASKAARVVAAAQGRPVIEFGTRRAHGFAAGCHAARAAYIGGCRGTSNVAAGRQFGIPIVGTLAHSFVMAFADEAEAFRAFRKVFPDTATILVDTYDTLAAVELLAHHCGREAPAVRLDSGDLGPLSKQVRQLLDAHGMIKTQIFVSGDLNEDRIAELLAAGAPIDGFGVGTELVTSADAPNLGVVYKLVSIGTQGRIKLSQDKSTYPHAKQVWRRTGPDDRYDGDVIARADEKAISADYRPLLKRVMTNGHSTVGTAALTTARRRAAAELKRLPADGHYPVQFSEQLERDRRELADAIRKQRAPAG